jgi:hypothetical protein
VEIPTFQVFPEKTKDADIPCRFWMHMSLTTQSIYKSTLAQRNFTEAKIDPNT